MPRPLSVTEMEFVNTVAKFVEENAENAPVDLAAEEIVYQIAKNGTKSIEMLLTESRFFTVMSKKKQAIGFDAR